MFPRQINILKSNSFLLFGARGTGKSTLLNQLLPPDTLVIDLLDRKTEKQLLRSPERLKGICLEIKDTKEWVFIDEIQKIPELLDTVHQLIETTNLKFALTGSSARKLKRGGANLLAGRAFVYYLFPLTFFEYGKTFDLTMALTWGTLPKVSHFANDEERKLFLDSYVHTYLKEEIVAEQIIRGVAPFSRFLEVAAQTSGTALNFSKIGDEVGVDPKTVKSYFQIVEETLVGVWLPAYHRSVRKKQSLQPKFYLFDCGIRRALDGSMYVQQQPWGNDYGRLFEQFIILELMRLNSYSRSGYSFSHLRTKEGHEVDLIIERPGKPEVLIEIKSNETVSSRDIESLKRFKNDFPKAEFLCLSRDETAQIIDGIRLLYWKDGLMYLSQLT